VSGSTKANRIAERNELRPARPLAAGELRVPNPQGGFSRFSAVAPVLERLGPLHLTVIPTTVETIDSTGAVIRRLRESFALELATAVRGIFEVPDIGSPSGWRTTLEFRLVEIR
jgi:hypothetical protein